MRIAFVQLASFGDCVNSTCMFEPIKTKWPDCRLEVHSTSLYGSAYDNNPHIDEIHKHPCANKDVAFSLYDVIPHRLYGYDKIMVPAPIIRPDRRNSLKHPEFGANLWCTFLRALEEEGIDYPWPPVSVLRLYPHEVERARSVASAGHGKRCILMETEGLSGQTHWNDAWTERAGEYLLSKPNTCLFLSRRGPTAATQKLCTPRQNGSQGIFVGHLSLRECAELHNHCQAFLSVSSGLCNACNTNWCRRDTLWVEAINSPTVGSMVFRQEHKHFYYSNDIAGYLNLLREVGL